MYGAGRDVTERHTATKELSALRHVATLAAEGVVPTDLFAVVAEEVARVVDIPIVTVVRYELDNRLTVCATFPTKSKVTTAGDRHDETAVLAWRWTVVVRFRVTRWLVRG